MRHGYVIELRCLKRRAFATEERVAAAARATQAQLRRYLADERCSSTCFVCSTTAWTCHLREPSKDPRRRIMRSTSIDAVHDEFGNPVVLLESSEVEQQPAPATPGP